ncbi:DUF3311 domain-containing protein [Bacillus smithii]|uniref:DUF3311 domain-containing protein n=1 Tax=Bacillus smithii TaxID=1479 RepID=UPI0030C94C43
MKGIRWLMLLPFLGILGGIPFVNRVTPYILSLPFILFWIVAWVIITSIIMAIVYRFDPKVKEED